MSLRIKRMAFPVRRQLLPPQVPNPARKQYPPGAPSCAADTTRDQTWYNVRANPVSNNCVCLCVASDITGITGITSQASQASQASQSQASQSQASQASQSTTTHIANITDITDRQSLPHDVHVGQGLDHVDNQRCHLFQRIVVGQTWARRENTATQAENMSKAFGVSPRTSSPASAHACLNAIPSMIRPNSATSVPTIARNRQCNKTCDRTAASHPK